HGHRLPEGRRFGLLRHARVARLAARPVRADQPHPAGALGHAARGRLNVHGPRGRGDVPSSRAVKSGSPPAQPRTALSRSALRREIVSTGMPFGQTAVHSPVFVQPPKPSASIWSTIAVTRSYRSGWPCGSRPRWVIFAAVNSIAEAFGQAATHAPQPMHVAASNAAFASSFGTGRAAASGAEPVRPLA